MQLFALILPITAIYAQQISPSVLHNYHAIRFTFNGPSTSETATPNPFRQYRFILEVTHSSGTKYSVPGFYAASGDAGNTGSNSGNKWRAYFVPEKTGTWTYKASFRVGTNVAINDNPNAGSATSFDNTQGSFVVIATNKNGRDNRGKGILRYVGKRYLRFDNGDYFIKGGADSPENLLAYEDFDGTTGNSLKDFSDHVRDWNTGNPTWRGDDRGKGLIGALNYLASTGANAFSFLTMNVGGDSDDVWPWITKNSRDRYDVSKLDQWDIVFSHADTLGMFLHFKTQETENDKLLNNGDLGNERKLYYRELIARFGHHHALNWNLGEENDMWQERRDPQQTRVKQYIDYFHQHDAYNHPVVIHSYPDQHGRVFTPLLGGELDGMSLQTNPNLVHANTLKWVADSKNANPNHPWVVSNDEQGNAQTGVTPDGSSSNAAMIRQKVLWGNLMAGGGGVEYYFGYAFPDSDLTANSWRSRASVWRDINTALVFFQRHLRFWEMEPMDSLALTPEKVYVFGKTESIYAYYFYGEGVARIRVPNQKYRVQWYNPREGGGLLTGNPPTVQGPDIYRIRLVNTDWVLLLTRIP